MFLHRKDTAEPGSDGHALAARDLRDGLPMQLIFIQSVQREPSMKRILKSTASAHRRRSLLKEASDEAHWSGSQMIRQADGPSAWAKPTIISTLIEHMYSALEIGSRGFGAGLPSRYALYGIVILVHPRYAFRFRLRRARRSFSVAVTNQATARNASRPANRQGDDRFTMTNRERIRKELSPGRRKKVEARGAQLIAEEMTLQELRHARKMTQVRMHKPLGSGRTASPNSKSAPNS